MGLTLKGKSKRGHRAEGKGKCEGEESQGERAQLRVPPRHEYGKWLSSVERREGFDVSELRQARSEDAEFRHKLRVWAPPTRKE
jgi:hypothetical protein